jgi:hypothetical protein
LITYKTPAFIVDDLRPSPGDNGKRDEPQEDHGDIATPEPQTPTDDDRSLD